MKVFWKTRKTGKERRKKVFSHNFAKYDLITVMLGQKEY